MGHIEKKGFMVLTFLLTVLMITGCYDKVDFTKNEDNYEFSKGPIYEDLMDGKSIGLVAEDDEGTSINILSSYNAFDYQKFSSEKILDPGTDFLWLKMVLDDTDAEAADAETRERNGDNRVTTVINGVLKGIPCRGAGNSNFFFIGQDAEKISGSFFGAVACDGESDEEVVELISGRFNVTFADVPATEPLPEIDDRYTLNDLIELVKDSKILEILERWRQRIEEDDSPE